MNIILETLLISMGVILASWGLFHQLIVGGAITIFKNIEENEARLFIMGWVAQGGFMVFLGIVPPLLIWLFGMQQEVVRTIMAINGASLLLLGAHVFFTGFSTHIKPIRIGAILSATYGFSLISALILPSF